MKNANTKCAICGLIYEQQQPATCPYPSGPEGMDAAGRAYMRCVFKETTMQPTTGRTVLYTISADDAMKINRRRTNGHSIAERMKAEPPQWPTGAQAHIGNSASEGDVVPMVVVRVWPNEFGEGIPGVNGQALLDGNDAYWVTSAKEGTEPGTWAWPARN